MSERMILVCRTHGKQCNEQGYIAKVKDTTHFFCCKKGFEQSLNDFTKSVKK